jgi:hypothetical protein
MSHQILNLPLDCDEILEFIEVFKLESEVDSYKRHSLSHLKAKWVDTLPSDGGFLDSSIIISKDGGLIFPFKHLGSDKLNFYLREKVGNFSLNCKLYENTLMSYEIDIPYNLGDLNDEFWGNLLLILNENFKLTRATLTFDSNENEYRKLKSWLSKCSWLS